MANPILNEDKFLAQERVLDGQPMTINGTIQRTLLLGMILILGASVCWSKFMTGFTDMAMALMSGGVILGFLFALVAAFTRNKYLIVVYSACEGLALGGISAIFETQMPGIVIQAVAGTFAALFSMLILYRTGVIKCTEKFRSVIFITTASIAAIYIVDFIGRLFLHTQIPVISTASPAGILFSVFVTAIAALNLIIDFDFIEKGSQMMLPKDYEWYGAFGLMVTLVWVYLEILKLLAKLNRK